MSEHTLSKLSITSRLLLSVIGALVVFLAIGIVLFLGFIEKEMTASHMDSVRTIATSLHQGVKLSLERGQMKNFKELLETQRQIKGVIDVSLYDRKFKVNLSSSGEGKKNQPLDPVVADEVGKASEPLWKVGHKEATVYMPQMIDADCIRCHPTWKVGEQGGVMSLVYDIMPLRNAIGEARVMFVSGALGLLFLLCTIIFFLARTITRPVVEMTEAMERLAQGDIDIMVPARERQDEIGKMAAAMDVFKSNAQERVQMERDREVEKKKAEDDKRRLMGRMAADFEGSVGRLIDKVMQSVATLDQTARTMQENAGKTMALSTTVAASSEQTSANVVTVAGAAEELSSSINEISRQVTQSAESSRCAVKKAEETDAMVGSLDEASRKIASVVDLITDIASQTNLLALNATIEAARAGEVGKGFAVVASEVKELAKQTTGATKDISAQISSIQGATNNAVTAIRAVGIVIGELYEIAGAIAAAVEEQGAVTRDIALNTQQAATGVNEVTKNITAVAKAANETGSAANRVSDEAATLLKDAQTLRGEVDNFLQNVLRSA